MDSTGDKGSTWSAGIVAHFSSCLFSPQGQPELGKGGGAAAPYKVNSFYLDSAGRVQVSLPLQLQFESKEALEKVLESKCIQPAPVVVSYDSDHEKNKDSEAVVALAVAVAETKRVASALYLFSVEARVTMTFGTGEAISATVEGVDIESSTRTKEDTILALSVVANIRVSRQDSILTSVPGVKLNLEVVAVLTEKRPAVEKTLNSASTLSLERQALATGLRNLYLARGGTVTAAPSVGGGGDDMVSSASTCLTSTASNALYVVTKTKLMPPILVQVSLAHALQVEARSMKGPTLGETWIALNICHSNSHNLPVTVANVSLHPAFSRASTTTETTVVVDMSQQVQWRFLEGTTPSASSTTTQFPKTLRPNEAYSTILYVTAQDDSMSRTFTCPISVTAKLVTQDRPSPHDRPKPASDDIVSVVYGIWTSAKRAMEPSDSFRVNFTLPEAGTVRVGEMFCLKLSVQNLSEMRKDVKVILASNSNSSNQNNCCNSKNNNNNNNTDLEKTNNNTGSLSLSLSLSNENSISFENMDLNRLLLLDDDKGNPGKNEFVLQHHCLSQNQLLAVDDSYSLGSVDSHQSAKAELRFIPLQAGTLSIPNLGLVLVVVVDDDDDEAETEAEAALSTTTAKATPVYYQCLHNLQVVATS